MMSKYSKIWINNLNNSQKLVFKNQNFIRTRTLLECYKKCEIKINSFKLRVSNHDLMIERGRYHKPKVPREQRLCFFCRDIGNKQVEDEMHFLCECPAYEIFREQFL